MNSHWLSVLHMIMYMFQCYSFNSFFFLMQIDGGEAGDCGRDGADGRDGCWMSVIFCGKFIFSKEMAEIT